MAEGFGVSTAVGSGEASSGTSLSAVSVTSVRDIAVSVEISFSVAGPIAVICSVWVSVSVDVTGGETSAFAFLWLMPRPLVLPVP